MMNNLFEKIYNVLTEMDENEIICMWNEYCYNVNNYDNVIMDYTELEEMINNDNDTMNWLNRFYFGSDDYNENGSANPNRNYFTFNGYGNIVSFDYIYNQFDKELNGTDGFHHLEVSELINYIIENKEDFNNTEIAEILEEVEENEEQ